MYPLSVLCRVINVSTSGYYKWLKHEPSKREKADNRLEISIKAAHQRGRGTYGTLRIKDELAGEGVNAGRDRIRRLRKKLGLVCKSKKKYKATTDSNHNMPVAANLLDRRFEASEPNKAWVSDITYVATDEGWLYVAAVKDLFNREVVGYAMSDRMTQGLVGTALIRAVKARKPKTGMIFHSDRGSQYCSNNFRYILNQLGMIQSMSRKGDCYDNAPIESFWGTLKTELVYQRHFGTRLQAIHEITEYIEIFYNRQRRHSSLGNVSPVVFLQNHYRMKEAA
jgi:putative transposase